MLYALKYQEGFPFRGLKPVSYTHLAAIGLASVFDEVKGELRVIGTPAEETNGAKVTMAEQGVFDDLDLAIMIHSSGNKSYVKYKSLAMDAIEFSYKGKPAHAASAPWEGRNALNGVQLFFHAIDMLRQHVKPEVRMHGIIYKGGDAPNIVPEMAICRFYFRAPTRAYLDYLVDRVRRIALGAAMASETVSYTHLDVYKRQVQIVQKLLPLFRLHLVIFKRFGQQAERSQGGAQFMSHIGDEFAQVIGIKIKLRRHQVKARCV